MMILDVEINQNVGAAIVSIFCSSFDMNTLKQNSGKLFIDYFCILNPYCYIYVMLKYFKSRFIYNGFSYFPRNQIENQSIMHI